MNVGDRHWVDFPPRNGHVQRGRRPAVVAQDASATARLPTILVIPLTTQFAGLRFPGTVLVDPDQNHGLRHASVALVFPLAVLDQRLIGLRMGQVSQSVMDAIGDALDKLTGRP
jgi:mRNA-degrading endonuclease toxin of MazEF toxin-antitoxin module